MLKHTIKKLPKSTVEIILNISKDEVKKESDKAFDRLKSTLTVQGFRKGHVPDVVAKKNLPMDQVYQEMIQTILPAIYEDIVKKENFKPIISPKVDLIKAKEGEDWEIKFTVCEKPEVNLGDYKKVIADVKIKNKQADIWVPGKNPTPGQAKGDDAETKSKLINQILEAILKSAKVEIPDLIVEDELNHRLSRLVDDVQKIGLTTDAYLKSKNQTMDSLKTLYRREIEDTYKLEFLLSEVADKESIKVEPDELNKLFANIKDDKEKKMAEANSYYYATILRKQKTIDFLISL